MEDFPITWRIKELWKNTLFQSSIINVIIGHLLTSYLYCEKIFTGQVSLTGDASWCPNMTWGPWGKKSTDANIPW